MDSNDDAKLTRAMRLDGRYRLEQIARAAYGVESIARVISWSMVKGTEEEGSPFNDNIIGGLVDASRELGALICESSEEMCERLGPDPDEAAPRA